MRHSIYVLAVLVLASGCAEMDESFGAHDQAVTGTQIDPDVEQLGVSGSDGCGTSETEQGLLDDEMSLQEAIDGDPDCELCGEKRVLVIVPNFVGHTPRCVLDGVEAHMDHSSQIFLESSRGETWLHSDYVEVDVEGCHPDDGCEAIPEDPEPDTWSSHRRAFAAARARGANPDDYDYVVMAYQQAITFWGPYGGYAHGYREGDRTYPVADVYYCEQGRVYVHEVGHLMGFGHSGGYPLVACGADGRDPEECFYAYGDNSDPMGGLSTSGFNAWQRLRKNWVTEDEILYVDRPTTAILGSVNGSASGAAKMAVIVREGSPFATETYDDHLVVSYRSTVGVDDRLGDIYRDRTTIHTGLNFPVGRANLYKVTGNGIEKRWDWRSGWVVEQVWSNEDLAIVRFDDGCFATPPTIEITRGGFPIFFGQRYTVKVRNNEDYVCPQTTYKLEFSSATPELRGVLGQVELTVAPQEEATTSLTVRDSPRLSAGSYPFSITAQGAPYIPDQGGSGDGIYNVFEIVVGPTEPVIISSEPVEVIEVGELPTTTLEPSSDP